MQRGEKYASAPAARDDERFAGDIRALSEKAHRGGDLLRAARAAKRDLLAQRGFVVFAEMRVHFGVDVSGRDVVHRDVGRRKLERERFCQSDHACLDRRVRDLHRRAAHAAGVDLMQHQNLVLLRTFSKAFSLAGVRLGYLLGNECVIREFLKVRQPYSVDAVSQAIGKVVFQNRAKFEPGIIQIISERQRMLEELAAIPGVDPYPSDSNYILFKVAQAGQVWQQLFDQGILIRDFSKARYLEGSLRVSVGTPQENDQFLAALRQIVTA